MPKQILILVLLIVGALSALCADEISVHLSQQTVRSNESFSVTFSSQQNIEAQPDFSSLHTDFDVLSNSQSFSTSIINGKVSQETSWNLVLMGKREGKLTIPSIKFGPYHFSSETVEVTQSHTTKQEDAIFLEVEVEPKASVFEQTPLIYTFRLYRSVQIAQAALSEVKTNDQDALIEQLGNDIEYEHHDHGKHYIVFERTHTILPQHAGELAIAPITFEGKVIVGGHSFFDVQTQIKRLHSDELKVEVKPIPAPFKKNNWLAANDVKLTEEWSADPSKMIVGEPITWTLTLSAAGCLGNQIPEIAINFPDDLKHYLDKPEISTQSTANGFLGLKKIKVALIATKPGEILLPSLTIQWWDLKTDQVRRAQLPARTIQVQGGNIAMNTSEQEQPITTISQTSQQQETSKTLENTQALPFWVWCLIGLNVGIAVGFFSVLSIKAYAKRVKPDSLRGVKSNLKRACQKNEAKHAEACLLIWARLQYPQVKFQNIMELKQYFSKNLQEAIDELYQFLYGQADVWSGDSLWKAFSCFNPKKGSSQEVKTKQTEVLQELYPRH